MYLKGIFKNKLQRTYNECQLLAFYDQYVYKINQEYFNFNYLPKP